MSRAAAALGALLLATGAATAQEPASRAWQQRLHLRVPLSVPMVELESTNPFAEEVDRQAVLLSSTAPRKTTVAGRAVVAAYVDAKGECLGAVPLDLPFPGLTSALVDELTGSRFEPARKGKDPTPSWSVVEVIFEGRVKESTVTEQDLQRPDPSAPPEPSTPIRVLPSGNLLRLPATPAAELMAPASPRRLKVKAPGREAEVRITAMVHITPEGRCDRYVPLELDSGFNPWLSAYLATWRVDPAFRDGEPVASWSEFTAEVQMRLSALQSTTFQTLGDRSYDPRQEGEISSSDE
jgi:hypothetical protein